MSTPAQVGKREYQAAITQGREASRAARRHLREIISATDSTLIRALVSSVLISIGESDDAINRLDEIGRTIKS